jgi:hypothetical protein
MSKVDLYNLRKQLIQARAAPFCVSVSGSASEECAGPRHRERSHGRLLQRLLRVPVLDTDLKRVPGRYKL